MTGSSQNAFPQVGRGRIQWLASGAGLLVILFTILTGLSGAWFVFENGREHILNVSRKTNDNASWLVGELDRELYRLKVQLLKAMLGMGERGELDIRVDLFASRIPLLDSPVVRNLYGADPELDALIGELKGFVATIDGVLAPGPGLPSRDGILELVTLSDRLGEPVRRLAVRTVLLSALDKEKDAQALGLSASRTAAAFLVVIGLMAAAIAWLIWQHRALNQAVERLTSTTRQLKAANEAKAKFLASMSHELRTPLNAVIGFSDIIRMQIQGPIDRKYIEYADAIHSSGNHLLELINDILDISKISSGKFSIEMAEVDVEDEIQVAVSMLGPRAERSGVNITCSKRCDSALVHGDALRIRQVIINLLTNAVKFTPSNGSVDVICERDGQGRLCLTIADTGCGMEEEQIAEALLPFSQPSRRNGTAVEGTGLGLPLAKGLVEAHGGTLEISSVPHAGTRVTVRFPGRAGAPPFHAMN